jgi:hypothetical protein
MRKAALSLFLVPLLLSSGACGDDGPAGLPDEPDFTVMADCVQFGVAHLALAVDASRLLFHRLDEMEAWTAPFGFGYSENTGEYTWELDFDFMPEMLPGGASELSGFVTPIDSVTNDFLQEGDIFTMEWEVSPHSELQVTGAGAFRAIHNGLTLPPNQTETIRMIPADSIWLGPDGRDGACVMVVNQLEFVFHHLLSEGQEIRVASAGFETTAAPGVLQGFLSGSAGSDFGSITGTFDGTSFSCTVDLDTYEVDCTLN